MCVCVLLYAFCSPRNGKPHFYYAFHWHNKQLTNTLQRKLDEVRREKSQLERQIEQEKNANASLQSQLNALRGNKLVAANVDALEEEEEMEEED